MKYGKNFINIKKGLRTEWIITNGIGGYSASSIIGANTRKYHGLLVAPLAPPARRFLILSKIDESIIIDKNKYDLYTNIGKDFLTEGYKYQEYFEKVEIPTFSYKIEDVKIEKNICMEYGKNTVIVYYKIQNGEFKSKLILTPIMNFRDFHSINNNHEFNVKQHIENTKVKVIIDKNNEYPIYINVSDGIYIEHVNDSFKNMFYIEEEKRGFLPEENHLVPGRFEVELKPNEKKCITFVCSLEENIDEIDGKQIIKNEKERIKKQINESGLLDKKLYKCIKKGTDVETYKNINTEICKDIDTENRKYNNLKVNLIGNDNEIAIKETNNKAISDELIINYIIASDNFIVNRPSFGLHTIIAGYPWFLDWGRDTLISFEGILLIPKRFKIAKEVLLTMVRDVKFGLVPNGYSGFDNRPLYNSADSSLLLFEQVKKYLKYTNDEKFVKEELYDILVKIIDAYINGINVDNNNIFMDVDFLISSGTSTTQNTWMDAKIGDFVVTPRNGKAVEINALWYNALKIMEEITKKFWGDNFAKYYGDIAKKCKKTFQTKFYNKKTKCLYDVLGDSKIRPNQLFAMSLSYPVLDCKSVEAINTFETVTKKLLNSYGLKTLAKGEEGYVEVYEGDNFKRDSSYHQGTTWPWLLGLYNDAFKNIINAEKSKIKKKLLYEKYAKFVSNVKKTFENELKTGKTVGSISEMYDSKKPFESKGAFAQSWSVAEVFRIILNEQENI